jgi:hypothetical protein
LALRNTFAESVLFRESLQHVSSTILKRVKVIAGVRVISSSNW